MSPSGVVMARRPLKPIAATAGVNLPNPDAFYRFEEATAAVTWVDQSTTANNLTAHGTITSATGKIGKGASLPNGNSTYLDHASAAALNPSGSAGDYTLGCWYNRTANIGGAHVIVSKWAYSAGTFGVNRPFRLQIADGSNLLQLLINSGTGTAPTDQFTIQDNGLVWANGVWHCILWWYDHVAGTVSLQQDGGTPVSNASSGVGAGATTPFRVSGDFAFDICNGIIDNLAIWHVVLTPAQRTAWYNGGAGHEWIFPSGWV